MLDLVIVHPGAAHGIYGSDLANNLIAVEPPLWCRLIAGYVRDHGFSVKIIDAEAMGWTPAEVANAVNELRPRLVCIAVYGHQPSASTQQMVGAGETARAIKSLSDVPIMMVGGHVAALPERTWREESVDYVCNGEGPVTILGLLERRYPETIPGLGYWYDAVNREYAENPAAPLLNVNDLHGNAWDLLPMERYRAHNWQCFSDLSKRQPYASIYTSLGCPYKCSFCMINSLFHANQYRTRDPDAVVDEMVMLRDQYGVRTFKIVDEMFVLRPSHYLAIADGLYQNGFGDDCNIWAYARVDTVKPENLSRLRRAGFRWLALGIESGSKHVRDGAEKALRNDDIEHVVRSIQAAGISVIGNYIFGLPDDDMETMQATLDLALSLKTEFANFYSAMAYPGSRLYTETLERGGILPETWRGYSQHNDDCRPLDTEHVDAATVLRFRDEAFVTYFTNPAYLAMVERKFGAETLDHVKRMTTFKLKRKLLEAAAADRSIAVGA